MDLLDLITWVLILLIALSLLIILIFEITMVVDAWRNPKLNANQRALWIVGMFFIHPFVAIFYFFSAHSRLNY